MATNTIIIRDDTRKTKNLIKSDQVNNDGTIKTEKLPKKPKVANSEPKKKAAEPNRKMRAVNSTLNTITGGFWERGSRFYRASSALLISGSVVGATILTKFAVDAGFEQLQNFRKNINEKNQKDNLRIRTGDLDIGNRYSFTTSFFGRRKYKSNS